MADIILEDIKKSFAAQPVLTGFSAVFPDGKVSCIMAPSGSGKTTLLRILAGLEQADSGVIRGLENRRLSMVFQTDRLCDYLTPVGNLRLVNPSLSRQEIVAAMERTALRDCADKPCHTLSGGMRRRCALLRALYAEYDVLLLDEPFKGLDEDTRALVMEETNRLRKDRTTVLVTHDASEAAAMNAVVFNL